MSARKRASSRVCLHPGCICPTPPASSLPPWRPGRTVHDVGSVNRRTDVQMDACTSMRPCVRFHVPMCNCTSACARRPQFEMPAAAGDGGGGAGGAGAGSWAEAGAAWRNPLRAGGARGREAPRLAGAAAGTGRERPGWGGKDGPRREWAGLGAGVRDCLASVTEGPTLAWILERPTALLSSPPEWRWNATADRLATGDAR
eukprot:117241-Chlamydomonas_euryale.AAC.2